MAAVDVAVAVVLLDCCSLAQGAPERDTVDDPD